MTKCLRRSSNFEKAWRDLFELQWPKRADESDLADWQMMYWEAHLQRYVNAFGNIRLFSIWEVV